MIKALFLICEPPAAWDRVIKSDRSFGFIFSFYLLPMALIITLLEGCGLITWGRTQWNGGDPKIFSLQEVLVFEAVRLLMRLVVVFVCAQIVKAISNASYKRHTFLQGFTVAAYGLSPLFLMKILNIFPFVNPWLTWALGMMLCIVVLYHGLPQVMQPDPSQAFGLYFISSVVFVMITGLEQFIAFWYLTGRMPPLAEILSHFTRHVSH